jgi:hypothetical protein
MSAINRSYTMRLHGRIDIPSADKFYHRGPDANATGSEAMQIAEGAWRWLTNGLARDPKAKVILIGHSRGGRLVTELAVRLSRCAPGSFVTKIGEAQPEEKEPQWSGGMRLTYQKVHFLGLYDAVDVGLGLGDNTVVPQNVVWLYHARRDPLIGSHSAWGNSATLTEKSDPEHYHDRTFLGTHGALGGTAPGGFVGPGAWNSGAIDMTAEDNLAAGDAAHEFIVRGAWKAGIPVRFE